MPTYTCGDYQYQLLDDGTAVITEYNGDAESLEIASELDGYVVTAIGDNAVSYYNRIKSITIANSITTIDEYSFSSCDQLVEFIVLSDHPTLATINGVLFEKTTKTLICFPRAFTVKSYTIPNGITTIGENAFFSCKHLTSITIPDSVTTIGNRAFFKCKGLTLIDIPDSVTVIGNDAFYGCKLKSIDIPDSVTVIGDDAFAFCDE